jgi:hypothetical protein
MMGTNKYIKTFISYLRPIKNDWRTSIRGKDKRSLKAIESVNSRKKLNNPNDNKASLKLYIVFLENIKRVISGFDNRQATEEKYMGFYRCVTNLSSDRVASSIIFMRQ